MSTYNKFRRYLSFLHEAMCRDMKFNRSEFSEVCRLCHSLLQTMIQFGRDHQLPLAPTCWVQLYCVQPQCEHPQLFDRFFRELGTTWDDDRCFAFDKFINL